MKHSFKITLILLSMFFLSQVIGILVISTYAPQVSQVADSSGNLSNVTVYNIPYGMDPPAGNDFQINLISIVLAIIIAVSVMFFLMKFEAALFLRLWFFFVVSVALAITINAGMMGFKEGSLIALIIAVPLAFLKVFKRNIIIHNLTELLIYPGIAVIFVPLLNIWTIVALLVIISIYDGYAVWHFGFMQKMAKYQIQKLKLFSGFFVPYLGKKERELISKLSKSQIKNKKIKVNVAILGGGDVVFPIMLAGVVLRTLGVYQALIIASGATLALAGLFYISKKGKFYPAMPFISAGCFVGLALAFIIW